MNASPALPCPFCESRYRLVGDPWYYAVHTVPACATYASIDDALAFAVAARRAMGIPDPDRN